MTDPILVLLAEDEDLIQNFLGDAMTDAGFALVIARTGIKALAELDTDAKRFRAVVTDIRLEKGLMVGTSLVTSARSSPRCPWST